MIHPTTISEVKQTAQILDIISPYLTTHRRGQNHIAHCPFHNEKTPSFTISPAKNIYKCFGCGKTGNPITFLIDHLAYTYPEAITHIAELYNIPLQHTNTPDHSHDHLRQSINIINTFAADHYHKYLSLTAPTLYLNSRNINPTTRQTFQIGFAPASPTLLKQAAHYNTDHLITAGLLHANKKEIYLNRIIFPLHDASGQVIAFSSRAIESKTQPKYLNTPETPYYKKSNHLYGLFQAKKHIQKTKTAYLVEGHIDVLIMHQTGFPNVVASGGTALSPTQAKILHRYAKDVIIVYDSDAAGQKATISSARTLLSEGINTYIIPLPADSDPDSYINNYQDHTVSHLFKNPIDIIIYFSSLIDIKSNPDTTTSQLSQITKLIDAIADPIKQSVYTNHIAATFKINLQTKPSPPTPKRPIVTTTSDHKLHLRALYMLIIAHHYHPATAPQNMLKPIAPYIDHPAAHIIDLLDQFTTEELQYQDDPLINQIIIDALMYESLHPSEDPIADLQNIHAIYLKMHTQKLLSELTHKIKAHQTPPPILMAVYSELLKNLNQLK